MRARTHDCYRSRHEAEEHPNRRRLRRASFTRRAHDPSASPDPATPALVAPRRAADVESPPMSLRRDTLAPIVRSDRRDRISMRVRKYSTQYGPPYSSAASHAGHRQPHVGWFNASWATASVEPASRVGKAYMPRFGHSLAKTLFNFLSLKTII